MQVMISHKDRAKFLSKREVLILLRERGLDTTKPVRMKERFDTLDLIFTGEAIKAGCIKWI